MTQDSGLFIQKHKRDAKVGGNGSWNIRKSFWRYGANQVASSTWFSGILAFLGQTQILAWRHRLSQLDPTRVRPAAAPLRPSTVFASSHYASFRASWRSLLGLDDFDPILGLGRGQVLPGASGYGQQANVGGILPPGGRGGRPADLTTPIFLAAGAADYLNGMQGAAPGGASFNPFGHGWVLCGVKVLES